MELTDGTIALRPPRPEDTDVCFAAVLESLPELIRWMPWAHERYERAETEAWIAHCVQMWGAPGGNREFFIWDLDERFLGGCGLMRKEFGGEIGYWVRTSAAGHGVATAAARLLAGLGASERLATIVIRADPGNLASQRVAEKVGGVRAPDLDTHTHDDGTTHELVRYTLTG